MCDNQKYIQPLPNVLLEAKRENTPHIHTENKETNNTLREVRRLRITEFNRSKQTNLKCRTFYSTNDHFPQVSKMGTKYRCSKLKT
jgi:hypothetical protein